MQIHGCGLFNIKELFGSGSYMESTSLQLIIELDPAIEYEIDPLAVARTTVTMHGVEIPRVSIPRANTRNLPLIIELLVRKEIQNK